MKGYPGWFLRVLLATLLLVLASGLLLTPTTLTMRFDMDVAWRLPGAARILAAAAHAVGGFAAMLLLGALWSVHMRAGWRRHRHRASGALVGGLLLLLALSAVGLYYLGEEQAGALAAALHLGIGLVLVLPFGWHWIAGRRSLRAKRAAQLHSVNSNRDTPSRRHTGTR